MSQPASDLVDEGTVTFSSDSKLLSEIGERLISTPDIALSELIKNAYDADSTKCNIWLEDDNEQLIVKDDGHGMTKEEFLNYWMTVATTSRLEQETSRRFERELTGAKGVGRFAVRNLGLQLELSTVAYYDEADEYRRLTAEFKWADFQSGETLQSESVEYQIERATQEEEGTELRISELQRSWSQEELEEVSGEVLDIISAPYEPNRSELETEDGDTRATDPGFSVYFARPGEGEPTKSAAQEIYERYAARVEVRIDNNEVIYECEYPYGYGEGESGERMYRFDLDENLIGNLSGEIRYFNSDYGLFSGMETVDGRSVPKWLRENGGVRIIDKQFRVPPYGDRGNDWLNISESHARRERRWRSSFVSNLQSEDDLSSEEVRNQQLNLPRKNQVLGSLQVSSYRPDGDGLDRESVKRLVPAMDRQGFVQNEAFEQLRDIARGGLEIIAIVDREEELRRDKEEADEAASELKKEIEDKKDQAEEEIDSVVESLSGDTEDTTDSSSSSGFTEPDLDSFKGGSTSETSNKVDTTNTGSFGDSSTSGDTSTSVDTRVRQQLNQQVKPEIKQSYEELEKKVERFEDAQENLRTSVESMYLMSAVAAFMTHETSELLRNADEMIESWESVPKEERSDEFEERLRKTREARDKFTKQLGYAKRFISGLDQETENELYVNGKIDEVVDQFSHYTQDRDIQIQRNVPQYLKTPEINPSIYTGVIMNLFTNAVKALLDVSPEDSGRVIQFDAENTDDWHILRVSDTGSGIPEGMEDRIFDPLFSTTDRPEDDPLGGGVGLGLYVVKRVVERSDGKISVVEAPDEFETCFEVRFER